jgi:hypothetical protein
MIDLAAHARSLIGANLYLTLGTADAAGSPWAVPVCFSPAGDREFLWVSEVDARHSRNLAARPQVSLVIFDSTVPAYHGRAVYADGTAGEAGPEALAAYNARGVAELTPQDVTGDSPYRLYRATATRMWVLCPREPRQPCELHGEARDHRTEVPGP